MTLLTRVRALAGEPVTTEESAHAAVRRARLRTAVGAACGVALLAVGGAGTARMAGSDAGEQVRPAATAEDYSRWFRPGSNVPAQYRQLIVEAGTTGEELALSSSTRETKFDFV